MDHAAIHVVQFEGVTRKAVQASRGPVRKCQRSGRHGSALAYSARTGGVSCSGSTVKETSCTSGIAGGGLLHLPHQRTHAGTGAGAGGEDEVGDPDFAVQRLLSKGWPVWDGQLEAWDLPEDRQRPGSGASSDVRTTDGIPRQPSCGTACVTLLGGQHCRAASSSNPNAAVTARLMAAPEIRRGRPWRQAVAAARSSKSAD